MRVQSAAIGDTINLQVTDFKYFFILNLNFRALVKAVTSAAVTAELSGC